MERPPRQIDLRAAASGALVALATLAAVGAQEPADRTAVEPPEFSVSRGFQHAPVRLTLSSPLEGAVIRFTRDGSPPLRGVGEVFREPIEITTSTAIRARVEYGDVISAVAAHTYILPSTTARQPRHPPGWITTVVSVRQGPEKPQTLDYEMDPDIVGSVPESGDLARPLADLPALAISIPVTDFNFLYANHRRRGSAWERAASVELIYPGHARYRRFKGFQIDCGLRMQGGLAVDQARKKSFRLLFKKRYGAGKLRYPIFESSAVYAHTAASRFDTLVLRGGGNANWSKDLAWKHEPTTYLRDQFARDTQLAMSGVGSHGVFVHLWINGLYHGLYNVVERPDARFLSTYLGGGEEDWFSINHGGPVAGDASRWEEIMSLLSVGTRGGFRAVEGPLSYRKLAELVDVTNFCDYVALNWALGMGDWPYNNWYAGQRARPFGPLMFFNWDSEYALWATAGYQNSNPGAWVNPRFRYDSRPIAVIWRALETSPDFRLLFSDRVYRACARGGALSDERLAARFRRRAAEIEDAIVAESARWGDAAWGQERRPRTRAANWYPSCEQILRMIDGNAARFIAALRAAGYYPRIDPPGMTRVLVPVRDGSRVLLTGAPEGGEIWATVDGTDPRASGGAVSPTARRPEEDRLDVKGSALIRARVLHRGEWSALAEALVLIGDGTLPVRITELMYHPPESEALEFIEIRNTSSAPIELTGVSMRGVDFRFPPGAVLRGNATIVLAPNDDPEAFRARYPGVEVFGTYRGHLSNSGEEIALVGFNGTVICSVSYDDSGAWPKEADGGGLALEWTPDGWGLGSEMGGTPGRNSSEKKER